MSELEFWSISPLCHITKDMIRSIVSSHWLHSALPVGGSRAVS